MDQLSRDALAAQKLGISYGQYMARKPQPVAAVRFPKKERKTETCCVICGAPILPGTKRRRYCSAQCADQARAEQIASRRKI